MKNSAFIFILFSFITLFACSNDSNSTETEENNNSEEESDSIIVETSSGSISEEEFIQALKDQYGDAVLRALVQEKVILSEAERLEIDEDEIQEEVQFLMDNMGVSNEDQFYEMMQMQGISGEADLRKRVLNHLVMQHHIGHVGEVTEEELLEEYARGEEVEARHILVDSLEEAEDILEQLSEETSFEQLAMDFSQDPASREDGGNLGVFRRGTMAPTFEEAAFQLDEGIVSEPVESPFGFHIIEVLERIPFEDDFEEVVDQLRSAYNDRKLYMMNEKQNELFENIEIEVFDDDFEHLFSS